MAIMQLQLLSAIVIFLCVVFMNVTKKNSSLVMAYLLQSICLVVLLSAQAYQEHSPELFLVTMCMLFIKGIVAPQIFLQFIRRSKENFSASTYLNVPMTLGVVILLTLFAQSDIF